TDYLGRDLLSRIMVGTRVSLFIGIVATFFDLTIGVFYGIISGWRGGLTDTLMQRVIEVIPGLNTSSIRITTTKFGTLE
ncbi:ABC transporter permease, partial [Lactiplantibacillus plantarum]